MNNSHKYKLKPDWIIPIVSEFLDKMTEVVTEVDNDRKADRRLFHSCEAFSQHSP